MSDVDIQAMLQGLGKKRKKLLRESESLRQEIHGAAARAKAAGWNNQSIAKEIGVTREIIRRHVGPWKVFADLGKEVEHGEQERS